MEEKIQLQCQEPAPAPNVLAVQFVLRHFFSFDCQYGLLLVDKGGIQFYCCTNFTTMNAYREELDANGYAIINNFFSDEAVASISTTLQQAPAANASFRSNEQLYAIRKVLNELPALRPQVLTAPINQLIAGVFSNEYFVVKSIYFNKPGGSNWFVSYHQDLTISVKEKHPVEGFGPWSSKQEQYAVQPPLELLQDNFTLRIHLDDTDAGNGALKVIPGSHRKGIYRPETIDWQQEKEVVCAVQRGGVMLMRPLLLHASGKTTDNRQRRVLHIEFSRQELPAPLQWSELLANG